MNVARVDDGNVVVNIEVVAADWVQRTDNNESGFRLIPYTDANPAYIGLTYDPDTGVFEQPPVPPTADNALPEGTPDE